MMMFSQCSLLIVLSFKKKKLGSFQRKISQIKTETKICENIPYIP